MWPEQEAALLHRLEEVATVRGERRAMLNLGNGHLVVATYRRPVLTRPFIEGEPVRRAMALISIAPEPWMRIGLGSTWHVDLLDGACGVAREGSLDGAPRPVHLAVGVAEAVVVVRQGEHEAGRASSLRGMRDSHIWSGTVVVRTVQAGERVLPEQIGPHPPARMAVSRQGRDAGSHLDDGGALAIRKEVVKREVHGFLRDASSGSARGGCEHRCS